MALEEQGSGDESRNGAAWPEESSWRGWSRAPPDVAGRAGDRPGHRACFFRLLIAGHDAGEVALLTESGARA